MRCHFSNRRYEKATMNPNAYRRKIKELLEEADVHIGGDRPWDVAVHDDRFFAHVLGHGSLGAGESYMDRWWDCPQLDELCVRVLDVELDQKLRGRHLLLPHLKARLLNLQTPARSFRAQLNQLWQVLFSPSGIRGSYEVPR